MAAAKRKLDIFSVLKSLDQRDLEFYKNLTPEERKEFAPVVVMRWMSAVKGSDELNEYYIHQVNDRINKNLWHSGLTKHTELIAKSMAMCGIGKKCDHVWVKGFGREKNSKFVDFLRQFYPTASKFEIEYLISINTEDQLVNLVRESGLQDGEMKSLVKEIKELKK
jgi:hypothetical protein